MSYRARQRGFRGFGEDGPVPAPANAEQQAPTVIDKTPPFTQQTLSLMAVAALPWIPVAAGYWAGDRFGKDESAKAWGSLGGAALSFFTIRHFMKKMAGAIT